MQVKEPVAGLFCRQTHTHTQKKTSNYCSVCTKIDGLTFYFIALWPKVIIKIMPLFCLKCLFCCLIVNHELYCKKNHQFKTDILHFTQRTLDYLSCLQSKHFLKKNFFKDSLHCCQIGIFIRQKTILLSFAITLKWA